MRGRGPFYREIAVNGPGIFVMLRASFSKHLGSYGSMTRVQAKGRRRMRMRHCGRLQSQDDGMQDPVISNERLPLRSRSSRGRGYVILGNT